MTGFQKPISTLDGRTLLVHTVRGEVVNFHQVNTLPLKVVRPDEMKIVRGEGMPRHGESSGKGNLIIRWVQSSLLQRDMNFRNHLTFWWNKKIHSRFDVEFPPLLDPLVVDALVATLPAK